MAYSEDLCSGGTITASSDQSGNEAANCFDDNTGTRWQSNAPVTQWIKYQFSSAHPVGKLRINPFLYLGDASIKDFVVYGSNDDSAWDNLHSGTFPNESGWHDFNFTNATAYLYIKVEITSTWNANPSLYEMEMMEKVYLKHAASRYDVKQAAAKSVRPMYAVTSAGSKNVKPLYSVTQPSQKTAKPLYHVTQSAERQARARYHVRTPVVEIYNAADSGVVDLLSLGLLKPGEISAEFIILLWNSRDEVDPSLTMDQLYITATLADSSYSGGDDPDGAELVSEKWLELKSDGVVGSGITDDAQSVFTPVGGDPQSGGLAIGAIPSGTARQLHCRVNIPAQPTTPFACRPRLLVRYNAVT